MHEHGIGLEAKLLRQANRLAPPRPKHSGLLGFHCVSTIPINDIYHHEWCQVLLAVCVVPAKKGKDWYFGMKAHVAMDSKNKIIHSAVVTRRPTWPIRPG